jgi:hypothetical protein
MPGASPDQFHILIAYAELLGEEDLSAEAMAEAPVPDASPEEILANGPGPIIDRIAAWASTYSDEGIEQSLIDRAAGLAPAMTRVPGGLGHGGPGDLQDTGGGDHLENAVENGIRNVQRILGSTERPGSSSDTPQADDH